MQPLGKLLLEQQVIDKDALEHALLRQHECGSRLGDILISERRMRYPALYRCLARQQGMPLVNLSSQPPDAQLLQLADAENYLHFQAIPWRKSSNTLTVAVCDRGGRSEQWARQRYGEDVRLALTSPLDISRCVQQHFSAQFDKDSRQKLWRLQPKHSARLTLWPSQRQSLGLVGLAVILAVIWMPQHMLLITILLCNMLYLTNMALRTLLFYMGRRCQTESPKVTIPDRLLPVYTVLVPMYREAASLQGLIAALQKLDYPQSKLDIKLVLEADDTETYEAACRLRPGYQFEIIRVPPSEPRTKPKACNYALKFARGEYVTVFDADDRPEPDQLKKAVMQFAGSGPDVACLQARLNYYNANDNLLTRHFALEYTLLFNYYLPALERLNIPIPLGGTSNHLALSRLRAMGEWDPYNVTEDADLGTRLAALGLKTRMLDSLTLEEAPVTVPAWLRQRSRWVKGYLQTFLVHLRHPAALYKSLGALGFAGFIMFIGMPGIIFLSTPPMLAVFVYFWLEAGISGGYALPNWLGGLALVNLVLYLVLKCRMALSASAGRFGLAAALSFPLYFLLHSAASYKSFKQLIFNPHFWEKTMHGLALKPAGNGFWAAYKPSGMKKRFFATEMS